MTDTMIDDQELPQADERQLLLQRARDLGIGHSPNIGTEKLKQKVADRMSSSTTAVAASSSDRHKRIEARKEAMKLIRVTVINNNPSKKDWSNEILTVGNKLTGDIKRCVPFGTITHVENFIYQVMLARQTKHFYTESNHRGQKVRKHKMIPEFGITVHPPLTKKELEELAADQRARNAID